MARYSVVAAMAEDDLYSVWWEAVKPKVLIDKETFMREAATWSITPIRVENELAALLLQKGNEVHFIKTGKHQFTRSLLRKYLKPGVITRLAGEDRINRAFITRLGFIFTGTDGLDYFYKLERLRHV